MLLSVSGVRDVATLQNLGLAAEHGLHFRFPGELKMSDNHLNINAGGNLSEER